ncbi:hypothetical protein [Nocardia cyriacigeorgica]|jgi:hypothetical protein|uniref:hypothetical protein n=2 Tax=Nocardia cyriacigeorgica TaxID=135487 RepID=UPI0002F01130|nr:hypothetical protein [Nocardia cyriacigeorgica]AVH23545.1 hypothetical protein C5B73_21065 [Nocardia cyriacigeorgica]MBF6323136.1 hypothetical protein [Nocardia cyriacigeorgica]MBF6496640.1 hypothetical protein [Nocardia cyriacigeorgica]PPJ15574.1 hypothetical protein C5E43_05230 [Nocardia cyriacigeorgica]TLF55790.1 hypothetical protein FEK31_19535 [Nocardia cyriacigeorgica]
MKLELLLAELQRGERRLEHDFTALSARHHAEHELRYIAGDLAGWSHDHLARLERVGPHHPAIARPVDSLRSITAPLQRRVSDLLARRPEPAVLLLMDLRHLHRASAGVSLDWELLAQAAQALRKPDLLELTQICHPQTLRQLRWTNAMLKVLSPQIMAS